MTPTRYIIWLPKPRRFIGKLSRRTADHTKAATFTSRKAMLTIERLYRQGIVARSIEA